MINTKELRVGNYLIDEFGNTRVIVALGKKSIEFEFGVIDLYENCSPIPLTEEWLLNFGIKSIDDNPKEKYQYEGDILFSILDHQFSNSIMGGISTQRGFYSWGLNGGKVIYYYVHQLQNLYFTLTGEELNFK